LNVDADPPALTLSATAGASAYIAGDWTGATVIVSGTCTDAESGVASAPAPLSFAAETAGTTTQRQCTDLVGHDTSVPFGPIRIDKTAPAAPAITPDRAADAGSWYRDTVTLTFAAAGDLLGDGLTAGVGVDAATLPAPVTLTTSGQHLVKGTVKDLLGHASAESSLQVSVDADPPAASLSCPATVTRGDTASGQSSASDGDSGLAGPAEASVTLDTATVGEHTAQVVAADVVGHETTATCTYQVVAPPAPTPTPTPTATPTPTPDTEPPTTEITASSARVRDGAISLPLSVDEAAVVTITVRTAAKIPGRLLGGGKARVVRLGKVQASVDPATGKVKLKLSRKVRRLLRKLHKVPVKLTVRAVDAAGNATSRTVRMTLRSG
jgi:hypothetical protein